MAGKQARRFDRAFKLVALERMAAGENVSALGRELGVRRKLLYPWRETVRRGGVEALRGVGRPRAGVRSAMAVERPRLTVPRGVAAPDELARARQRIAALERKIGQQALELDFFAQALRLLKEADRRPSGPPDAPASTVSSGPGRGGRAEGGTDVRARRGQPGRLRPAPACIGAGRGGDGAARSSARAGPGAPPSWLPPARVALAARGLGGEPQAGAARGQSVVPAQAGVRAGDERQPAWLAGLSEPGAPADPERGQPALGRPGARRSADGLAKGRWVADITYIRLAEAFAYLAVILDAYSRRAVGWALAAIWPRSLREPDHRLRR